MLVSVRFRCLPIHQQGELEVMLNQFVTWVQAAMRCLLRLCWVNYMETISVDLTGAQTDRIDKND